MEGAKVVTYFYKHYVNDFRAQLQSLLLNYTAKFPSYEIIFTGHSLGGALAVHATADTLLSGWNQDKTVTLYTLGQPRVANIEFLQSFANMTSGWYRLVHNRDIVAHIPPCIPNLSSSCYKSGSIFPVYLYHSAEEIFYNEDMSAYKECSLENGEDPDCSNSLFTISPFDHMKYFGIDVGHIHERNLTSVEQILK